MAIRLINATCATSTSAGNCKKIEFLNPTNQVTNNNNNNITTSGLNSPACNVSGAGVSLEGALVMLKKNTSVGTFIVNLQEGNATSGSTIWTTRASSAATNVSTLSTGSNWIYIPFSAPYTSTTNEWRINIVVSSNNSIAWWRNTTASNYTFGIVGNGDDATGYTSGDTLFIKGGVTFTMDQSMTLAPTSGVTVTMGDNATWDVSAGSALTLALGSGRIQLGSYGNIQWGTSGSPITGAYLNVTTSLAANESLFIIPSGFYSGGDFQNLKYYGATTEDLRIKVSSNATSQAVINTNENIPASWTDGDTVTFAAKATSGSDTTTYTITKNTATQLTLNTNLNAATISGGALINLSLAQRALGIQITSTNRIYLTNSGGTGLASYCAIFEIQGVYGAEIACSTFVASSPSVYDGVVNYFSAASFIWGLHLCNGSTVNNVHFITQAQNFVEPQFYTTGSTFTKMTIKGFCNNNLTTSIPISGTSNTFNDVIYANNWAGAGFRALCILGFGHTFNTLTTIGGYAYFNCSDTTVNNYSQSYGASSGTFFASCANIVFNNPVFGISTGNTTSDIQHVASTRSTVLVNNGTVGSKGINASYLTTIEGTYLQFHNYGTTVGDHRTWKTRGLFTSPSPYTTLVQKSENSSANLSQRFQLLSETIASKLHYLVAVGNIPAGYYAGTNVLPKIDIYDDADTTTPSGTAQLSATTGDQTVYDDFTPSTSNNQVILDLQTRTDATGTNAEAIWKSIKILQCIYGQIFTSNDLSITETLTYPIATLTTPVANPYITEANQATVHAYTGISINDGTQTITLSSDHTIKELYDYIQDYLSLNPTVFASNGIFFNTIDGVNFTSTYNIILNSGVQLTGGGSIDVGVNTFTEDSVGDYDGTIIQAGVRNVLLTAPNIVATSRVRIYNVTQGIEYANTVLGALGYKDRVALGTDDIDAGDEIKLYATQAGSSTAKKELSSTGIMTTTGLSFVESQEDMPEYASWGINGSTVSEYYPDYGNIYMSIDDPDGQTVKQRFMAFWMYNLTTEDGIRNYFGGITIEDVANYRVNVDIIDLKLFNVNSAPVLFTDTARLYRSDGTTIVSLTTTGSIILDAGRVYKTDEAELLSLAQSIKAKTDFLPENIQKNTALNNFMFTMIDQYGNPKTGLTVYATKCIDGGTFVACTNSPTEVSSGVYRINLSAADLNGDFITLRFFADNAKDTIITLNTTA
jgi:hypothetical protein